MTQTDANTVTIVVDPKVIAILKTATPKIVARMVEIATKGASEQASVAAGKLVLGLAGYVAPAPSKPVDGRNGKPLSDMTPAELKALIDKNEGDVRTAERILSDRAAPVNAPTLALEATEVASVLD